MAAAINRSQNAATQAPFPDNAAIMQLLSDMNTTSSSIDNNLDTLTEQSVKVNALTPTMHDATQQIQSLRREVRKGDKKEASRIEEVKKMVSTTVKPEIVARLRHQIQQQVAAEIILQVDKQVVAQIKDHLPVSLEDQVTETNKQLENVRFSLTNSEARRNNSVLRIPRDMDEPIHPVLMASGSKSKFFPANLRTLFAYDLKQVKALANDYDLPENKIREINLNNFISHIGIQNNLIVMPS